MKMYKKDFFSSCPEKTKKNERVGKGKRCEMRGVKGKEGLIRSADKRQQDVM